MPSACQMSFIQFDRCLYNIRGLFTPRYSLDRDSRAMLLGAFRDTEAIAPSGDDDRKAFFIRLPRGTYRDYVHLCREEDEEIPSEEEFLREYRDEEKWYRVEMRHYADARRHEDIYSVFIDMDYIFSVGDRNMSAAAEAGAVEFVSAFREAVGRALAEMREGTYNKAVRDRLPYEKRSGKILRKDYWDIYPERREKYAASFSAADREEFLAADVEEENRLCGYAEKMTARDFFEACAAGYRGAGVRMSRIPGRSSLCRRDPPEEVLRYGGGYTPREWYMSVADGRDDGLAGLPLDDPDAFAAWMEKKEPYYVFRGSHPWEVVPSASVITSLHFGVEEKYPPFMLRGDAAGSLSGGQGYRFVVWGASFIRSPQTVAFYLAVKRAGYPVVLRDAGKLRDFLLEKDLMRITPYENGYPGAVILEEEEKKEDIIRKAVWDPEEEVRLTGM